MKRRYVVLVLAALVTACSDTPDSTAPVAAGDGGGRLAPAQQILRGTVVANQTQEILPMLDLRLDDGTVIGLTGQESMPLVSVIGAEVEITGNSETATLIEVQRFVVLSVGGKDVSDGVLALAGDGTYSLQLVHGGARPVIDPPSALAQHVGERVWLIEDDGAPPQAFGVIRG